MLPNAISTTSGDISDVDDFVTQTPHLIRCTCTSIYHPYLQSNSDASNFVWLNIWHRFRSMQTRLSWRFDRQKHSLMFYVCQPKLKEKCTNCYTVCAIPGKMPNNFIYYKWVCRCQRNRSVKGKRTETNNTQTHTKKKFLSSHKNFDREKCQRQITQIQQQKNVISCIRLYLTIYCINKVITLHQTAQSVTAYCEWLFVYVFVYACLYICEWVFEAPHVSTTDSSSESKTKEHWINKQQRIITRSNNKQFSRDKRPTQWITTLDAVCRWTIDKITWTPSIVQCIQSNRKSTTLRQIYLTVQ